MEEYNLVGVNGNAFCVMAYVKQSMKKEGKTKEEIQAYSEDAQSSDYNHLIFVSTEMIDELNEKRNELNENRNG